MKKLILVVALMVVFPLYAFAHTAGDATEVFFKVTSTFSEPISQHGWINAVFFEPESKCLINPPPVGITYVCVTGKACRTSSYTPFKERIYALKPGCNTFQIKWFAYADDENSYYPIPAHCTFSVKSDKNITLHITGRKNHYRGSCSID